MWGFSRDLSICKAARDLPRYDPATVKSGVGFKTTQSDKYRQLLGSGNHSTGPIFDYVQIAPTPTRHIILLRITCKTFALFYGRIRLGTNNEPGFSSAQVPLKKIQTGRTTSRQNVTPPGRPVPVINVTRFYLHLDFICYMVDSVLSVIITPHIQRTVLPIWF